jgi:DNA polymerase
MAGAAHKQAARPAPAARADEPTNAPANLADLRAAAAECRNCPLWAPATQTVFGEGPDDAAIMLVGEQPGDQEDLAGKPFVGPAGQMLDRALEEAGIDRDTVFVTNAVKHFKFVPRGKKRLHQKPNSFEIRACRQWLEGEVAAVRPKLVVAMGATAAHAVFGRATPIGKNRGRAIPTAEGRSALVTVHPSYLLRMPEANKRAAEFGRLVDDLRLAAALVAKGPAGKQAKD